MVLAGGQGSRLKNLTQNVAKPAVAFGGKYRIVDFVLSNCTNSGIDTVGVLTQYKPWVLNKHIGVGKHWDLDNSYGGISLLPPYMSEDGGDWYKGTADAIYQNLAFLDNLNPEYVLILSGDHVYKMNYAKMLDFHKSNNADVSIAVIDVPIKEASRFGILSVNEDGSICEFEEKPDDPKSTLASMGIYVFTYDTLRKYLINDAFDASSSHDFGKNIIPEMLKKKAKMYAYAFEGYWRDIGTVESIWEANMDLLNEDNKIKLYSNDWKIYTKSEVVPPEYVGENAVVSNSLISEGSVIMGNVTNSVIFPGVYIAENSTVLNSVIMRGARILSNVSVNKAIICEDAVINENNIIDGNNSVALIGDGINVKPETFYCREK